MGTEGNTVERLGSAPGFGVRREERRFRTGDDAGITQGTPGTFTVTALDAYGNVATGYTGTIHFTSSDPRAKLPADYTFTASDKGVHTFSATFSAVGTQSLTATDTSNSLLNGIETGIVVKKKK
jgi:hypothetical protein